MSHLPLQAQQPLQFTPSAAVAAALAVINALPRRDIRRGKPNRASDIKLFSLAKAGLFLTGDIWVYHHSSEDGEDVVVTTKVLTFAHGLTDDFLAFTMAPGSQFLPVGNQTMQVLVNKLSTLVAFIHQETSSQAPVGDRCWKDFYIFRGGHFLGTPDDARDALLPVHQLQPNLHFQYLTTMMWGGAGVVGRSGRVTAQSLKSLVEAAGWTHPLQMASVWVNRSQITAAGGGAAAAVPAPNPPNLAVLTYPAGTVFDISLYPPEAGVGNSTASYATINPATPVNQTWAAYIYVDPNAAAAPTLAVAAPVAGSVLVNPPPAVPVVSAGPVAPSALSVAPALTTSAHPTGPILPAGPLAPAAQLTVHYTPGFNGPGQFTRDEVLAPLIESMMFARDLGILDDTDREYLRYLFHVEQEEGGLGWARVQWDPNYFND